MPSVKMGKYGGVIAFNSVREKCGVGEKGGLDRESPTLHNLPRPALLYRTLSV